MSRVTYACTAPGCDYRQEESSRRDRTQTAIDERQAHASTEHSTAGEFTVRERWPWLHILSVLNVVPLVLSLLAVLGFTGVLDPSWATLGFFFPQIWGWFVAPLIGVITVFAILIGAVTYAALRPEGASTARRFYAGLTMSAFITAVVFPIGSGALIGMLNASLSAAN